MAPVIPLTVNRPLFDPLQIVFAVANVPPFDGAFTVILMELEDVESGKKSLKLVLPKIKQGLNYILNQAMDAARKELPDLTLCSDAYQACGGAEALVIVTEWNQFRMLDLERVKSLLVRPVVVDLRNIYDPASMRAAGFEYVCVGRS